MSDSKFQVNLRGVIDLLSEHLYSTPRVFVRELLQNSVDAIRARKNLQPEHLGEIHLEILSVGDAPATISIQDDGIGLTIDEVHQFLATIGSSSKRDAVDADDFIGQFGIGLLSGFVVSDEIVVLTRSMKEGAPSVEWRGRADGTYEVRTIEVDLPIGTQVFLRARSGVGDLFTPDVLREATQHYGKHLPNPIYFVQGGQREQLNVVPPWDQHYASDAARRQSMLAYGREAFDIDFLDAIPLEVDSGGIRGVAFVLPSSSRMPERQSHRVYLKGMLISEKADELLPNWAFFVRCVLNADELRPTASREAFYDDERLHAAREALGQSVRQYLMQLAKTDRRMLDKLLEVHQSPIKLLAVDDDEFYEIVIDWLPFETSLGDLTMAECVQHSATVRYAPDCDQFRQIASVAAAEGLCVINGGYTNDSELVRKLPHVFPDRDFEQINIDQLVDAFEPLTLEEREQTFEFVRLAELVLQPYRCNAQLQKFSPQELPVLYTTNEAATFLRSIEQTQELSDDLWSGVLGRIAQRPASAASAQLTFNYNNRLIRRLSQITDKNLVGRAIEMLYVQALLLGHYPLGFKESNLLGDGMLRLIEYAIEGKSPGENPGTN